MHELVSLDQLHGCLFVSVFRHTRRYHEARAAAAARAIRLKTLRQGGTLIGWKSNCLGSYLKHLADIAHDLTEHGIGFKSLIGQGAKINPTTANGTLVFGIFATLAEFEQRLVRERIMPGLQVGVQKP
jgi:DNA invertase Pin-like site-specific DNA recombinase